MDLVPVESARFGKSNAKKELKIVIILEKKMT